jgi:hypothetical protein
VVCLPPGRVVLRQSTTSALALPMLIAVVLVAIVISQLFAARPNPAVFAGCAGVAALDVLFGWYFLRQGGSTLVVTATEITFTRPHRGGLKSPPNRLVIERTPGSTLSFRSAPNGIVGSKYTGYALKLRDDATGNEVFAGAFGRGRVQRACESQGWTFS